MLVPNTLGFEAAAASSIQPQPFADFTRLVSGALGDAADRMKTGNAIWAAERNDMAATIKSAAFERAIANDPDAARPAEATLADIRKAARSVLEQVRKISG